MRVIRSVFARSVLQMMVLCGAAAWLSSTPVAASGFDCTAAAAACGSQCGTNINWTYQYLLYHEWWENGEHFWEWDHFYEYQYSSGIANFECDEVLEVSYCQCTY